MPNPENIIGKGWKKGQSGNPAGLPKGYVKASTILNKLLKEKMTVIEAGEKYKRPRAEIMLMKAVADAISDSSSPSERTQAREAILNRIEGKPVQPIGLAPDTAINIIISQTEDKL